MALSEITLRRANQISILVVFLVWIIVGSIFWLRRAGAFCGVYVMSILLTTINIAFYSNVAGIRAKILQFKIFTVYAMGALLLLLVLIELFMLMVRGPHVYSKATRGGQIFTELLYLAIIPIQGITFALYVKMFGDEAPEGTKNLMI